MPFVTAWSTDEFRTLLLGVAASPGTEIHVRAAFPGIQFWIACEASGVLAPVVTGDGIQWAALFTQDLDLATVMHAGVRGLTISGADTVGMLVDPPSGWGIVIDPGSPHQFVIEPEDVRTLAHGGTSSTAARAPADHQGSTPAGIVVGCPVTPLTPATTARAVAALSAEPLVHAAWIGLWMIPGEHAEPAIVAAVQFAAGTAYDDRYATLQRVVSSVRAPHDGADERRFDGADIDSFPGMFTEVMTHDPLVARPHAA